MKRPCRKFQSYNHGDGDNLDPHVNVLNRFGTEGVLILSNEIGNYLIIIIIGLQIFHYISAVPINLHIDIEKN